MFPHLRQQEKERQEKHERNRQASFNYLAITLFFLWLLFCLQGRYAPTDIVRNAAWIMAILCCLSGVGVFMLNLILSQAKKTPPIK